MKLTLTIEFNLGLGKGEDPSRPDGHFPLDSTAPIRGDYEETELLERSRRPIGF